MSKLTESDVWDMLFLLTGVQNALARSSSNRGVRRKTAENIEVVKDLLMNDDPQALRAAVELLALVALRDLNLDAGDFLARKRGGTQSSKRPAYIYAFAEKAASTGVTPRQAWEFLRQEGRSRDGIEIDGHEVFWTEFRNAIRRKGESRDGMGFLHEDGTGRSVTFETFRGYFKEIRSSS